MPTLDLKPILPSAKINTVSYDDTTGDLTFNISTGIALEENVLKELLIGFEESAQNQRTNLDSPISQKAFPDSPAYAFVNRTNADGSVTQLQVERVLQFVLWLTAPDLDTVDAVNDND